MTLQEKLQRFAELMRLTIIADRAGISRGSLNNYVHRGSLPNCEIALRIARVLGVSVEWLIDDEQSWPPVYEQRQHSSTPPPNSDAA